MVVECTFGPWLSKAWPGRVRSFKETGIEKLRNRTLEMSWFLRASLVENLRRMFQ